MLSEMSLRRSPSIWPSSFDDVTDAVQRVLVERAELREGIDFCLCEDLGGARVADSEDVGETDARLFVARDIDSSNTCHGIPFRLGSEASPQSGLIGLRRFRRVQRKP